jgi:shikimate kinase
MHFTPERPIALVGLMGAGKSAVARELGERLGTVVADLDAMIEADAGCTVAELFERAGEATFRRREGERLRQSLAAGARVIACGGGVVLDPSHRALLRERCTVVWLEVDPATAARRVAAEAGRRPLLADGDPVGRLAELLAARAPLYAEAAHLRIPTEGRDAAAVASDLLDRLASGVSG